MTTTQHEAYASIATDLSTGLDSLANNTNSSESSAIDNTTDRYLFMDVELNVAAQGGARSTGAYVSVYMTVSEDGTNYTRANETTAEWVCDFPLDAATTATRATRRDIPIPALNFKLFVRNATGQAFASSGNTLKHRLHSVESV